MLAERPEMQKAMETIKIEIEHSNKDYKILKITALTNNLKSNDFQIFLNMWQ